MRALPVICVFLIAAGCTPRSDLSSSLPDRGGHATVIGGGGGSSSRSAAASAPSAGSARAPVATQQGGEAGPGETTITVAYGETLYVLADRHGVSLRWLIERNQLQRRARPGDRLVVPANR